MVSGLQLQTCLTRARTARAQGRHAVPPLLPQRPPPCFRLQSSDTSSLAARPCGRIGGGARPRGGADPLFPAPASPGNAFTRGSLGYLPRVSARCSGRGLGRQPHPLVWAAEWSTCFQGNSSLDSIVQKFWGFQFQTRKLLSFPFIIPVCRFLSRSTGTSDSAVKLEGYDFLLSSETDRIWWPVSGS